MKNILLKDWRIKLFRRKKITPSKNKINRSFNPLSRELQKKRSPNFFPKQQIFLIRSILLNQKNFLLLFSLTSVILILIGIVKIAESDITRVQNIEVLGTEIINPQDIVDISNLTGQHIFSVNMSKVEQKITNINGIEEVSIRRKWINGIEITISESQGWGYWQHDAHRVLVDESGKILTFARPAPVNAPTIIDFSLQENSQKMIKVDQDSVKLVARLESEKRFAKLGLKPISYVFEDKRGLTILLENAPNIVMGDASNYFYKIATLQELLSRLKKSTSEINEIDLRFGSNVVIR